MIPPYSHEEIKCIVDSIDITQPLGKRDYAIMLFAFDTGLRGIDIIRLKKQDVDWKAGTLSIKQSKTKHPITQVLKGIVLNALADYILNARTDNGEKEIFLSHRSPCNDRSTKTPQYVVECGRSCACCWHVRSQQLLQ